MPDPTKKTISATQAPALFNVSPWVTRWMLHHWFASGLPIDGAEDSRMSWGKKLEPLIVQQAAEDLRLEVRPNAGQTYARRGLLGCTRDATIICPDRGPGALETKCVFDFRTWMRDWVGGREVPKHYEIQLQQQMAVGDEAQAYRWGVLAVWVAGEVHYFDRKPLFDLWDLIGKEAAAFFDAVTAKREPDPFGSPVELPWLNEFFPVTPDKLLDLSLDDRGPAMLSTARQLDAAAAQKAASTRETDRLRAAVLGVAKDAERVGLPGGAEVRIKPHGKGKRITFWEPSHSVTGAELIMAG
jgi:hypothetical protein